MARRAPKSAGRDVQRVEVRVELKPGVLDAEAESVQKALDLLGLKGISRVGVARVYTLEFPQIDAKAARRKAELAVERLLANPVIHRVEIRGETSGARR